MKKAALYIHIPFCKKACHYCNFHFSTQLQYKSDFVKALLIEIEQKSKSFRFPLTTIYFGGGTPSVLEKTEIIEIFNAIRNHFDCRQIIEIDFEINPEDAEKTYFECLQNQGVNRLSIGIQSFETEDLIKMNRNHNGTQAEQAIALAQDFFPFVSADLIYGLPEKTTKDFEKNIEKLLKTNITHFSAYHLTIEKKTAWEKAIKEKKITLPEEETVFLQWEILTQMATNAGFEQYEISNFAKNKHYSQHNLQYWQGNPYLGMGPSAHSFDGQKTRSWNIASNQKYIQHIFQNQKISEMEILTEIEQKNETLFLGLRTKWGINLTLFEQKFGKKNLEELLKKSEKFIFNASIIQIDNHLQLSKKGKLLADQIVIDLFF